MTLPTPCARALLTAALLAAAAGTARGQTRADTARLDTVVVTASRVPVSARLAPGTVTVIDGASLRGRGIATVAEALREVPGIIVAQSGSFGGVTSVFTRGGNSNYTKVLVDGVPVNDPGGSINVANLTTDDVARIEVVRGPVSVLYGSDAVSGVVQIFTRRGGGPPTGSVAMRGGSYRTIEGTAGLTGGGDASAYAFEAAHRETGGIYPFNSRYRNDVITASLGARGAASDVTLSGRLSDGRTNVATDYAGAVNDSNHYDAERRGVVALSAASVLSERAAAHAEFGYSRTRSIDDDRPASPGDSTGYYPHVATQVGRAVGDTRVDYHVGTPLVLTGGVAAEWQAGSSNGYSNFGAMSPFSAHRHTVGGYAQAFAHVGEIASFTVSGRHDDNSRYGRFDTYRAAANVPLPGPVRFRTGAGTGYKEPSFYETFNTAYTTGNAALRPERTTNVEGGLELELAEGRATIAATYFRQHFHDLIQYRYDPDPTRPSYFNVGGARASGAEFAGRLVSRDRGAVGASYTFLETVVTDSGFGGSSGFELGRSLVRRPKHAASLGASLRLSDGFAVAADAVYVGRRDDLDFRNPAGTVRVTVPPYTVLDVSGEFRLRPAPAAAERAVTLRVTNALDRRYQSVFNFRSPGRTVLVGVRFGFASAGR